MKDIGNGNYLCFHFKNRAIAFFDERFEFERSCIRVNDLAHMIPHIEVCSLPMARLVTLVTR